VRLEVKHMGHVFLFLPKDIHFLLNPLFFVVSQWLKLV